jgi:hypothetical protein
MNASQEKALFHLTGQSDLSKIQESTLKQMAAEYPYFAPVHLFLAEKWQSTDTVQFEAASQKANLYFTNPYWLHFQLNSTGSKTEMPDAGISLETIIHQTIQPNYTGQQKDTSKELPVAQTIEQAVSDPLLLDDSSSSSPEIPVEPSNSISNDFSIPTIEKVKEMMRGIDKQLPIESTDSLPMGIAEVPTEQPIISTYSEPAIVEEKDVLAEVPPIIAIPEDKVAPESKLSDQAFEADDTENEAVDSIESYDETRATADSNAKISSLLSGQLADFKKPVTDADQLGLPKDPMHTIDYFASQGIKIDLSQIPQDKLTTHLRRFTDWLKYMKSENPNPIDLGTRKDLEEAVEIIAQTSNESKEVLTESMADVLQKQGQIDKAIQLYIKLSSLNPEKSAYFAAKIQHLKGIQ